MKFLAAILALALGVAAMPAVQTSGNLATPTSTLSESSQTAVEPHPNAHRFMDLIERVLWINEDSGIDIEKSFCDGNNFEEVIMEDHPDLEPLVNEMVDFQLLVALAGINFKEAMCHLYRHGPGKRDDNYWTSPIAKKLKTPEDVRRFLAFMQEIKEKIGTLE